MIPAGDEVVFLSLEDPVDVLQILLGFLGVELQRLVHVGEDERVVKFLMLKMTQNRVVKIGY
jgi:hypothetical protein